MTSAHGFERGDEVKVTELGFSRPWAGVVTDVKPGPAGWRIGVRRDDGMTLVVPEELVERMEVR